MRYVPPSGIDRSSRGRSLVGATFFTLLLFVILLYSRPPAVLAGAPRPLVERPMSHVDVLAHGMRLDREHGFLLLSGEARNATRRALPQLEAVVEFFDDRGRLTGVESALVKMGSIAAGDEAPFEVQARDEGSAASYRVRFRRTAGELVPSETHPVD
jgi:hypothetical protein